MYHGRLFDQNEVRFLIHHFVKFVCYDTLKRGVHLLFGLFSALFSRHPYKKLKCFPSCFQQLLPRLFDGYLISQTLSLKTGGKIIRYTHVAYQQLRRRE